MINIEPGREYLLDGDTIVKVLKSLNRSNTMFCIEIPGHCIQTVERDRLQAIQADYQSAKKSNWIL